MRKPRVVIRAFTLRRDAACSLLLARQLEDRGCAVIVASGRDFVRILRFWKPDVVVINTVGQIERCAELAPGAAIVMLPGEGANAKKHCDAVHLANAPDAYEKVDRFLLWGKATLGYFREMLPDADHGKLVVCGNPRLDLVKFNPDLLRIPAAHKTVGFIGRYHTLNRYNAVPAIFSMQRPEKRDGVIWQVENFFCMIALIRRLIEDFDVRISVRPHPLEAPEGYSFMNDGFFAGRVEIDDSFDLAAWTARQRVIVAPSSQSFYEACVLGVPLINIDPLTGNDERIRDLTPHAALSQIVSYSPNTYDEALDMIMQDLEALPRNPEINRHLDEFHDWFAPESATRRAADEIADVAFGGRRGNGIGLPTTAMDIWDRASFRRAHWRDPLHANFSYHRHFHPTPGYFDTILSNIRTGRSILDSSAAAA